MNFILILFCFVQPGFSAENKAAPEFLLKADETKWKKISDESEVHTYQNRQSVEGVVAFRGETIIPSSLEKIATVLRDQNLRKQWVDGLQETKLLETVNDLEQVEYNRTHAPWPFQDRDFVFRAKIKVDRNSPRSLLIAMNSEENPQAPKKSGVVRGEVLYSYYFMKELPGKEPQTEVIVEMALDPKGVIPLWLVNLEQKRWPRQTLLALKKLSVQPDLVVPKEIADYFKGSQ